LLALLSRLKSTEESKHSSDGDEDLLFQPERMLRRVM